MSPKPPWPNSLPSLQRLFSLSVRVKPSGSGLGSLLLRGRDMNTASEPRTHSSYTIIHHHTPIIHHHTPIIHHHTPSYTIIHPSYTHHYPLCGGYEVDSTQYNQETYERGLIFRDVPALPYYQKRN